MAKYRSEKAWYYLASGYDTDEPPMMQNTIEIEIGRPIVRKDDNDFTPIIISTAIRGIFKFFFWEILFLTEWLQKSRS